MLFFSGIVLLSETYCNAEIWFREGSFYSWRKETDQISQVIIKKIKETILYTSFCRLQEMEDEFYTYVSSNEVASELDIKPQYCELLYNYWKLKRKVSPNS